METTNKPLITQGWLRASIYLIVFFFVAYLGELIGSFIIGSYKQGTEAGDRGIADLAILQTIIYILFFLLTWLMRKFVDRQSFKSLGFEWKGYSDEAWLGFFAAIAMLGLGSLILVALGYLSFTNASIDIPSLVIEIVLMIEVAFVEELIVRGYLLNNLMQSMNRWIALGTSSLLFSILHMANPDVSILALANIVVAGFLLGLNYIFTKNLWFGIFFHFAWNYFQGPVFGYDVSGLKLTTLLQQSASGPEVWTGGPFGFEGSLLCVLLTIIVILTLSHFFIRKYEPQPMPQ